MRRDDDDIGGPDNQANDPARPRYGPSALGMPAAPPPGPQHARPPGNSAKGEMIAMIVVVVAVLGVLLFIGARATSRKKHVDVPASPAAAPQPAPPQKSPPGDPDAVARFMKRSSVFGIPIPKDAKSLNELYSYSTESGAVLDFIAFYKQWMGDHGWTFEPKFSNLDPLFGPGGSLSQQTWCKPTQPITTVGIHIGSGTSTDAHHSEIAISVMEDEDSCP